MCFNRVIAENIRQQKIMKTLLILHRRMPMVTLRISILGQANLLVCSLSLTCCRFMHRLLMTAVQYMCTF